MRSLNTNANVDNSDLVNYPDGRVKNNTGIGNGTPVNERVYGDLHQTIAKLMRLYEIIPNNSPDNETNGFQIIESLVALASKNDYVIPLSLNTGVLSVPIKLGSMKDGEAVICQAGIDFTTETQIKGSDAPTFTLDVQGEFKTNERVELIKTSAGVTLVRLADHYSLDAMNQVLFYLKKASQADENTGAIDTKGTTPLSNLTAFIRRVNGLDSGLFLATLLRNGLYSSEHFALVEDLRKVKNKGFFTGYNTGGGPGVVYGVGGNIDAAISETVSEANNSTILVTMANAMDNLNYKVSFDIESLSNIESDNDCGTFVFKPVSTTQYRVSNYKAGSSIQSLKVHMEVKQL